MADRMLDVNLSSARLVTRAVLPSMLDNGGGKIIFMSSNAAKKGFPNDAGYSVAKAGLMALTKVLAVEYGTRGIETFCVHPGLVAETDMGESVVEDHIQRPEFRGDRDKFWAWANPLSPTGFHPSVKEIEDLVTFLAVAREPGAHWNLPDRGPRVHTLLKTQAGAADVSVRRPANDPVVTLVDRVYRQLREAVVNGEYPPGTPLRPESAVAHVRRQPDPDPGGAPKARGRTAGRGDAQQGRPGRRDTRRATSWTSMPRVTCWRSRRSGERGPGSIPRSSPSFASCT